MNLVFQAAGLSVGEAAFLMACCNHTDDRGYVIASMQQLADEAHMKDRTARENKQRLIKRGLLAAKDRYSPKNGARIADLYRVNVDLLTSMRRPPKDYGESLVEELTFASLEETAGQTPPADSAAPPADSAAPPADSAAPPADSATAPPADSAPLLPPSSSPSSLSSLAGDADGSVNDPAVGERESEAAPENNNNNTPSEAEVPQQRDGSSKDEAAVSKIVAAYAAALGRPVLNGTRAKLEGQAVELLAQGLPEAWLCDRAREMAPRGWSDLITHADKSTVPLTASAASGRRSDLPEWCGECGADFGSAARLNPRFRKVDGKPCPHCHPDQQHPEGA